MKKIVFILIFNQLLLSSCSADNVSMSIKIDEAKKEIKSYNYSDGIFGESCNIKLYTGKVIKLNCSYLESGTFGNIWSPIISNDDIKSFSYDPNLNILVGSVAKDKISKNMFIDSVKDAISYYNDQYEDISRNNTVKNDIEASWN